ncbi:MAG: phytanoyl-CoA dioxygenase family protein [Chloroflexota bacterium]
MMIQQSQIDFYNENGYAVVRGMFSTEEVEFFKTHYEEMRVREQAASGHWNNGLDLEKETDPLKIYPRIMQPHRRDEASLNWLTNERINSALTAFLGAEPFAVQTMFYFKPPGARGQALHQDQYYLRVQPGTCMAAWMAIDDCDADNGCIRVVPGSQEWPLLCLTEADTELSFTDVTVPLPEGEEERPVPMKAGDVLFFNGQIVHGSLPNSTTDRFRRSLIGHYIVGEAKQVYEWYHPVLRMDGTEIEMGTSEVGGTCGIWVDKAGQEVMELQEEIVNEQIFGT